jgi:hypothetical protein
MLKLEQKEVHLNRGCVLSLAYLVQGRTKLWPAGRVRSVQTSASAHTKNLLNKLFVSK